MKKLSTTILILIIAISAKAQVFGSFDRTFRQVTLDSVAAYNDSIYMLDPVTFREEPFIMGELLSDFVGGGGSVDYGYQGQVPYMNAAGDGFSYTSDFSFTNDQTIINNFVLFEQSYLIQTPDEIEHSIVKYEPGFSVKMGSEMIMDSSRMVLSSYEGGNRSTVELTSDSAILTGDFYLNGELLGVDTCAWTLTGNTLHPDNLGYNVGIGTNTSGSKLGVNGTCFASRFLGDLWESNATDNFIDFDYSGTITGIPLGNTTLIGNSTYAALSLNPFISVNSTDDNLVLFANSTNSAGKWGALICEGDTFSLKTNNDAFVGLVYDNVKDTSLVDSSLVPKRYVDVEMAQYEVDGTQTASVADTWYSVMGSTVTGNQSAGFSLIDDAGYVKVVVDFDGYLQLSGKATVEYVGTASVAESIELRPTINGSASDIFYTSIDRSFDANTFYEIVSWVGETEVSVGDTLNVKWRTSTTNLRLNGRNGDPAFALYLKELKVKEQTAVNFTPLN